jgi:hypothetical protein
MKKVVPLSLAFAFAFAGIAVAGVITARSDCRSPAQRARCGQQAAELKEWLQTLAAEGGGTDVPKLTSGMKLVALDERAGGFEADAPTIAISGGVVLFDGTPAGNLLHPETALHELDGLKRDRETLWQKTHPGKTLPPDRALFFAVDRDESWSDVAALVDIAARLGIARLTFVFEGRHGLTEPKAKIVPGWCRMTMSGEAVDPSQKPRMIAEQKASKEIGAIYEGCPEVRELFVEIGKESFDPSRKQAFLEEHLPSAIEACRCNVDIEEVKADQWCAAGRYGAGPKVGHTIAIAPRGAPGAFDLVGVASEPWSTAHARVVEASLRGGERVTLVASR